MPSISRLLVIERRLYFGGGFRAKISHKKFNGSVYSAGGFYEIAAMGIHCEKVIGFAIHSTRARFGCKIEVAATACDFRFIWGGTANSRLGRDEVNFRGLTDDLYQPDLVVPHFVGVIQPRQILERVAGHCPI